MKIAVLLTSHNRKDKTISCLSCLFNALTNFNNKAKNNKILLSVFLVNDGCTDGTTDAILKKFKGMNITILYGDGNLYWAGGMRFAWNEALNRSNDWDYYLLLNDDTNVFDNVFDELLNTNEYCFKIHSKQGLYSGITCSSIDNTITTYGGNCWTRKILGLSKRLDPSGTPQQCDFTNANILMISKKIVDKIGIFYEGYSHDRADYDYSLRVKKSGFPVYLTANYCGTCDNDHEPDDVVEEKIISMNLKQRKKYFSNPKTSNSDYMTYIKRNILIRYPMVCFGRFLNVYFPKLYYKLSKKRYKSCKIYKKYRE